MKAIQLKEVTRQYKNNGQHFEQCARFTLTGQIAKADNIPFYVSGDIGGLQVKSARATICKGLDLKAHMDLDGATCYGYVTKELVMYVMNRNEYFDFCSNFSTKDRESTKNGGGVKLRLKSESKELMAWLVNHA